MPQKTLYSSQMSLRSKAISLMLAAALVILGFIVPESFGIAVTIAAVLVGLAYVEMSSTNYVVTTGRIRHRSGILSRKTLDVEVGDVRNVQVEQSALHRMLGVGNVQISSAGQSGNEIRFKGVLDPEGVAEIVRQARRQQER